MTLLDALAAAVRDRLLAGHAVALPGVGTLRRDRVTARVEPQPDGSSLLLPPSETVAFVPGPASDDGALASGLLRSLGTPDADPGSTLRQAIDQLEAHLAASGHVQLPGIGTMQRAGSEVAFEAAPDLLAAVSRPYEGLAPVSTSSAEDTVVRTPAARPPEPADASFIDEETLDDDLDDVLAVPLETSDPSLRAVLPLAPTPDTSSDETPLPERPLPTEALREEASESDATDLPPDAPPLAAAALTSAHLDDTKEWTTPAPQSDTPEVSSTPPEDELVTPAADELTPAEVVPSEPDPADLGWLDDYDSTDADPDPIAEPEPVVEPVLAAAAAGSIAPKTAPASTPHLPKPPPIIAGPVDPPPKRGIPIWLWMILPLIALAALYFWYRSTQTSEPAEPVLTAELAPEDELASTAVDTLTSGFAMTAADSADLALDAEAAPDTSTASPLADAAALEGEFPVEELSGTGAASTSSTPASAPPASRPAPPARSRTPSAQPAAIDRPDLDGLSDADREALTGTAPIISGQGGFSWVVLSTRDRAPADFRARQYRDAGWRVRVFQTEALGGTVYRVAVGQFTSRDQADRLRPYLPSQVPSDTWRLDLSTL